MLHPTAIEFYKNHPIEFCQQLLNFTPDQNQRPILRAISRGENVSVRSGHAVGKCREYNSLILLSNGVEKKAGDLIGTTQKLLSFDKNWNQIEVDAIFTDNGIKPIVCLLLENGTTLKITENHPLYVAVKTGGRNRYYRKGANKYLKKLGFTEASQLTTNHVIAVPTKIETRPDVYNISKEEARIIGYLIADGCFTQGARLSNSNPLVIDDFTKCAQKLGYEVTNYNLKNDRHHTQYILGFRNRLRQLGLYKKNSHQKFVPDCIKQSSTEVIASFLSAIYSCDASFSYTYHPEDNSYTTNTEYTSVSEQLAFDIRNLLLRFGINASIRTRKTAWEHNGIKKHSKAFTVDIRRKEDIIEFNKLIETVGKNKEQIELTKIAEKCENKRHHWKEVGLSGNLEWEKIKKIWKEEGPTVCISVPSTQTYLSNYAYEHNSALVAASIIWYLYTHPFARVPCTSQNSKQLSTVLWTEIHKWLRLSKLSADFAWTATKVAIKGYESEWFAVARTAREPEGLAGFHEASSLLYAVDESSGVPDEIFEVIDGSMSTRGAQIIMTGNPLRTSGRFFDSHHKLRDIFTCFNISSFESPYCTPKYILDMQKKWGIDSDIYRTRVLGEFPKLDPNVFIALEKVIAATEREVKAEGDLEIGVDVARYGSDLSSICGRRKFHVYPIETWAYTDTQISAGNVSAYVYRYRKKTGDPGKIIIRVDDVGLGGGCVDALVHLDTKEAPWMNNCEIVGVNFGGKGDDFFANLGTQAWGKIKENLDFLQLPNDDDLIGQLTTRRIKTQPTGRSILESKEEMKRRGIDSPDRADALALSFAADDLVTIHIF